MIYKINGREYEVTTFEKLSESMQKDGRIGTVKINGIKYDMYGSCWYNSVGCLVKSKEEE